MPPAVILAAGRGHRLRPLTDEVPKALVPVAGRPALHRIAERLRAAGAHPIYCNAFHHAAQIRRAARALDLELSEEEQLLGSGGALARLAPRLRPHEVFLIHNGDVVCDLDLGALLAHHRRHKAAVTMALVSCPAKDSVLPAPDGRVLDIAPSPVRGRLTYSGIAAAGPELLDRLPPEGPSGLIPALVSLVRDGRVLGVAPEAAWADLGTPRDYLLLHRSLLLSGRPHLADLEAVDGIAARGAEVHPTARLSGFVHLGEGARVGPGVHLHDCVVWPGTEVHASHRGAILTPRHTVVVDPL